MNAHLLHILDILKQIKNLSEEQKVAITKSLKDADKEMVITEFKLDRTEKVKRTTAILLEETIEELEQKNRKLAIEAALERVRTRTMAMHKSDELLEVIAVIADQMKHLEFRYDNVSFAVKNQSHDYKFWISAPGLPRPLHIHVPYINNPMFESVRDLPDNNLGIYADILTIEDSRQWHQHVFDHSVLNNLPEKTKKYILDNGFSRTIIMMPTIMLIIGNYASKPYTEEENNVFKRFAGVFEQSYTRFQDLQKAESQARKAEIEASLERVRAKAMAMHSSKDIESATAVVFNELSRLGIDMERCGIILMNETPIVEVWSTPLSQDKKEVVNVITGYLDFGMHPMLQQVYQDWREKKNSTIYKLVGDEVRKYYAKLEKQPEYKFPKVASYPDQQILNTFYFKEGGIFAFTQDDLSAEAKDIIQKFTKVFAQTYTRFLDIQKAEEQAKKAEIEASLERVRAKAMAMHSSKDIKSATAVVFNELSRLGINMERCGISLMNETPIGEIWSTPLSKDNKEVVDIITGYLDFGIHPILQQSYKDWREKKDFSAYKLVGDEVKKYYAKLEKQPEYKFPKVASYPDQQILNTFYFKEGGIFAFTVDELSAEAKDIIQKFTKVFAQTYTRFLDIQKAEAQAREAKIETALEKVRSRTMGMQSSDELPKVASLLFLEVQALGIPAWSCGYCILLDDRKSSTCIMSSEGTLQKPFLLPHSGEDSFNEWDLFVQSEETFFTQELGGKAIESHYNFMKSLPQLGPIFKEIEEAGLSLPTYQINHLCKFTHGFLLFITYEKVPDAHDIFKRFTRVFEQTYTRFLDLKKAEAQALEATKQASLDRVRGEIASMRSAKDLEIITPLVWNELNTLGIPFIRCGVFIVHEEEEEVEVYLSKPDGTSLAVMHLPFGSSDLANQTVDAWKQGRVYTQHWTREEFLDWGRSMVEQGQVQDLKSYRGAESPPESLNLHFIPFKQGMLYVGSTNPLNNEEIDLAASLAEAFAIAYARYEDFVKLEKAKEGIENALADLKATQSQLVQQEKLASLGQLTAGIAHEIKNPLNFVNNFSELSVELIEEAREEVRRVSEDRRPEGESDHSPLKKGDKGGCTSPDQLKDADSNTDPSPILSILDDIEANLRKIHEHGSRADGIVKSMLQHSRGGDGKMEPTDLNSLVKEYVNLAFHGMRAGKEPINVDIDLQLDESVGDVPLISEDFSRVILNLCNNGFDAMREKLLVVSGQSSVVYQPKLTVRTKSDHNKLTLEIEDNGPGIPEEIKDKILQPFFTTKKGTAGTGLGLSITNDIIKAHGGILEVETGAEGSAFSIIFSL